MTSDRLQKQLILKAQPSRYSVPYPTVPNSTHYHYDKHFRYDYHYYFNHCSIFFSFSFSFSCVTQHKQARHTQ